MKLSIFLVLLFLSPVLADIPVFFNTSIGDPNHIVRFKFVMPSHLGLSPTWNMETPVYLSIPLRFDYTAAYVNWNTNKTGHMVKFFSPQQSDKYLTLPIGWYGPEWHFVLSFRQNDG